MKYTKASLNVYIVESSGARSFAIVASSVASALDIAAQALVELKSPGAEIRSITFDRKINYLEALE